MGSGLKVYENDGQIGGIWDHGNSFYLVFKTAKHPDLWAGLQSDDQKSFTGEVVKNQFSPNEKRAAATARLIEERGEKKIFELTFKFEDDQAPTRVMKKKID